VVSRKENGNAIKSLTKALNILTLFSQNKNEWNVKEMAEVLGYHKSSIQRLVTTLEAQRFLERTHPTRSQYRLGPVLLMLGNVAFEGIDLRRIARPQLESLVAQTQETAHLCVVDQSRCFYLDKIDSQQAIRISTYVGQRLPLHCSAVGKALLSGMTVKEIDRMIERHGLSRFTDNTITERRRLLEEIELIRRRGVSFDNEEIYVGLRCVAAPVRDAQGKVVAAISVSGPVQRLSDEALNRFEVYLREAASQISEKLGYRNQDEAEASAYEMPDGEGGSTTGGG
jgi:DNA-binding IclR family transcriptional regulator